MRQAAARSGARRPNAARLGVAVGALLAGVLLAFTQGVGTRGSARPQFERPEAFRAQPPRAAPGRPARAEGEFEVRPFPRPPRRVGQARPRGSRVRPTGELVIVPGSSRAVGGGPVRTFLVEVERGLPVDSRRFAAAVQHILSDPRGWTGPGGVALRRVGSPPVNFRVALATPRTTDRLCAPLVTAGRFSCHQGGRATLNFWRWRHGADAYGQDLGGYRTYLVNHEVGHALGHSWHRSCPAPGARAPVMMQQTVGVGGCRAHPWPAQIERESLP
jgi:hypothetical protein